MWVLYTWGIVLSICFLMVEIVKYRIELPYLSEVARDVRSVGVLILAVAGIPMIALGLREHLRGTYWELEPETGRIYKRRFAHSLYFINVYYWGALSSILGLYIIFR